MSHLPSPLPPAAELERMTTQWRATWQADVRDVEVNRVVPSPSLTMLIIAYRSKEFLLTAIERVRACRLPTGTTIEVIVADCGGIDGLRPRLRNLADTVLTLTPDIGLNPARNASLAWARGDLVGLLDDDGEIEPGWIENAVRYFDDPAVLALRGRIVFKDHRYFTTLASHYDRGENPIDDTLAVEGNMAIRRGAYYQAGGFGNRFYGGEGAQLTYALQQTFPGGRVLYAPDVVMRHDFFQNWRHFVKKSMMYSDILGKLAVQEPEAQAFLTWMRADWDEVKPRRRMRLDERAAWIGLSVLRATLQQAAKLQAQQSANRGEFSPRR